MKKKLLLILSCSVFQLNAQNFRLTYYLNAIKLIKEYVTDPLFVLFSDDLEWTKQHFNTKEYVYCEQKEWETDYLQLHLISKCTHQIIANSSFSWWGAWLNENQSKIVVRPIKPFNDESLYYENHYPKDWLAI